METEKEMQIPVFTVWKNTAILKNIFLINAPPPVNQNETQLENEEICKTHQEFEETLVVGRHPDCDIRLEHPSISRFHLRIHSKPSSKHLFITDLSSVHGTWISDKRIEPNIRTRMNESDSLRIGGSSRVYKLHWIPLSQAYDVSNPFVPPLDFVQSHEYEAEGIIKDESSLGQENVEVQAIDSVSKGFDFDLSFDDDKLDIQQAAQRIGEKVIAVDHECVELEGLEMEGLMSVFPDEKSLVFAQEPVVNENVQPLESALEGLVPLFLGENWEWVGQERKYMACPMEDDYSQSVECEDIDSVSEGLDAMFVDENTEQLMQEDEGEEIVKDKDPQGKEYEEVHAVESVSKDAEFDVLCDNDKLAGEQVAAKTEEVWTFWCGSPVAPASPLATNDALLCTEDNRLDIEKQLKEIVSEPRVLCERKLRESVNVNSSVKEQHDVLLCTENKHLDMENQFPEIGSEPRVISERKLLESVNVNSSVKEQNESKLWSFWSGNMGVESSVCSSLSDASFLSEFENENKSLRNDFDSPPLSSIKRPFGSPLITSDQKSASSIWSRRGKLQSAPQISTSVSEKNKKRSDHKTVKHEPVTRALFHEVENQEEEEVFTPDKENFTPDTHKSMRKLAMLKEVKISSSGKSPLLKMIGSPKSYYEDSLSPSSDKEKYSPKNFLEKKTARRASSNKSFRLREKIPERMPFQSLLADSPQNSKSETCIPGAAEVSSKTDVPDKCSGEKIKKWIMLVDTTTLLNKESRKALQLLEGLKGTQLIIPKIVIKDLACLKRQTSFFRRNTEVSSALEWIEDCMVKTNWWIHVQNSTEGGSVAVTPPASPYSQISCGTTAGSFSFSALEFRSELLSPSTEDHVLDYAVSFKRNKNDGQLVLLSNDITLKIKAMAEGIICEPAEDFRESLVNPFSERFLWTDSSPRGQTWSYTDDFVLREKFYPSSLNMTPKAIENVKGLKLILLHNSQYYERMAAVQ